MMQPGFDQTIFVGGLHRSGTSLLARMLAEHPQIGGLHETGVPEDEGQHVQDVMRTAQQHGGPGRFALDPEAHLTEQDAHAAGTDLLRTRLLASWAAHRNDDKPNFVEKSPPNLIRFRYLDAVFPNAVCVLVVRHPIAVAHATEFWAKTSIAQQLEHWLVAHEIVASDRPYLRHCVIVRYEDLVADPQSQLHRVTDACGLAPHETREVVRTDTNVRYFKRFRHHRYLPAAVKIAPMIRRYESRLAALGFGYSLRDRGDR